MAFPQTPLDLTIELFLNGAWTDVTSLFYEREIPSITRGRADESQNVERSTCVGQINNRSGNFSPRNPTGAYYGSIGRNTPMRVRLDPALGYLLMPVESDYVQTPDSANLDITGDIDLRIDVSFDDWSAFGGLMSKTIDGSGQYSWAMYKNANGTVTLLWSANGTATLTATSTTSVIVPSNGRLAIRATLDVNVGGTNKEVKFYTSDTIAGTWTQLGSTVNTAGTTSIFSSTSEVQLGRSNFGTGMVGRIYAAQIYNGIAGTLRADVDFSDEEPGVASFSDGIPITWTVFDTASIVRQDIRFSGEVSEWPQDRDTSGNDSFVPITASGILRRMGQGTSPLKSTLFRGYTSASFTPVAYWPCEDGEGSTRIASGLSGHPPMSVQGASNPLPEFASFTDFKCSSPIPTFNGTQWTGRVLSYSGAGGDIQVWFLMFVPVAGSVDAQGVMTVYTTGTAREWRVLYESDGSLTIQAYDDDGAQLFTNTTAFLVNGKLLRVSIELHQNGSNVEWDLATLQVGQSSGSVNSGTLNSRTIGKATAVVANAGGDHTDIAVGHISVHDEIRTIFDLAEELNAYTDETAGNRIIRLCGEEDIDIRMVGDPDRTVPMGAQLPLQLVDLLREAAEADHGILFEPRDFLGLAFRTRESMTNQSPRLTLDYSGSHPVGIKPVDDDQFTRNDITVTRTGGGSTRKLKETGVLSVLAPPNGVGRYDDARTLNLLADGMTDAAAGWLLYLGTQDEPRYPEIVLNLGRNAFANDADRRTAAHRLDVGDLILVQNLPTKWTFEDVYQLAQGFKEELKAFVHMITINCSPGRPWGQVAVYEDTGSRYSSQGTVTTEALDTTETGIDVSTPIGPSWTHADGDFDIDIGGERMTVTAISGSGAAQTFTVTRSVNGVVKSHLTGATVQLADPVVYGVP